MSDETILSASERICHECGKLFTATSQWVYKLSVKGHTLWFCRYNCVRAAEKRINESKVGRGRWRKEMAKRPPKEELENDLRSGMNRSEIAQRYGAAKVTVWNWINNYGLKGLLVDKNVEEEPVVREPAGDEIHEEQLPTDEPVRELPKVEMNPSETYHVPPEPQGMTAEENMTDEEWEAQEGISFVDVTPEPKTETRETFDEIWSDVRSDLVTLERLYVAEAKKSFRERLREMLAEVVGEV